MTACMQAYRKFDVIEYLLQSAVYKMNRQVPRDDNTLSDNYSMSDHSSYSK